MVKNRILCYTIVMPSTQTNANGLFASPVAGVSEEVAQLQAELQVEKDRHHALMEKSHRVEKVQLEKDAAAALKELETYEETATPPPPKA